MYGLCMILYYVCMIMAHVKACYSVGKDVIISVGLQENYVYEQRKGGGGVNECLIHKPLYGSGPLLILSRGLYSLHSLSLSFLFSHIRY